jgi:flagellum-specific peptidoglycan hydrolase FlgJ
VVAVLALVGAIVAYRAKKRTKADFLAFIRGIAPEIEARYGIKPEITIDQAALESGYGQSGLAQEGNNLYGIKASKDWLAAGKPLWTGRTQEFVGGKAIDITDAFKKYGSWRASVLDWAELISGKYKTAYAAAKRGDLLAYGTAIYQTGYSTHPDYRTLLAKTSNEIAAIRTA